MLSQANPRGTLQFNGTVTGDDFADFLVGSPFGMSINYTNSLSGAQGAQLTQGSTAPNLIELQATPSGGDRYLRTNVYDLYATDLWQLSKQGLSFSLGVRWDYQAPSTELYGRLATVDLPAISRSRSRSITICLPLVWRLSPVRPDPLPASTTAIPC